MDWIDEFPGFGRLEDTVRQTLVERSRIIEVPKDTIVFGPGKAPDYLLLLLEGTLRVQQISESGREIVLYRVHAGESCVLTTACLLAYEDYSAEGITETDVRAVSRHASRAMNTPTAYWRSSTAHVHRPVSGRRAANGSGNRQQKGRVNRFDAIRRS